MVYYSTSFLRLPSPETDRHFSASGLMATHGPVTAPIADVPSRRKRAPRKLEYSKCEFCRKAKVKVSYSQNISDVFLIYGADTG